MFSKKMIRKVQSMDGLCIPSVEIKSEWVYPEGDSSQEKKASRFSSTYRKRSLQLSSTPEKSSLPKSSDWDTITSCSKYLDSSRSDKALNLITRSASRASISGIDAVEQDQDMLLFNGERNVPYGKVFIILFFLASVSSYKSDSKTFLSPSSKNKLSRGGSTGKNNNNRLGSAMIESVTGVLSPILPFTGGIDLRRVPWRNWFGILITSQSPPDSTNSSINSQTISLFPRGGDRLPRSNTNKGRIKPTHSITLSTKEPFVPTKNIAEMTLKEIALIFRYAIESNRDAFDFAKFFSHTHEGLPIHRRIVDAMRALDRAASESRGPDVLPADTGRVHSDFSGKDEEEGGPLSPGVGYGDVDALQFCAAMRLFAEWRLLRQVPAGYKAYAVGMNLGHKDIVQNVAKIENAVHKWIQSEDVVREVGEVDCDGDGGVCVGNATDARVVRRSPTLRQLLVHEIETEAHTSTKLPRLKDNTAAMGLLWVRRQLHYQTVIFRNVISVPEVYPSVIKAVGAAYSEVYDDVHGWAVQKIFNYSFQAAPDAKEIFRHMNPDELSRVMVSAAAVGDSGEEKTAVPDDVEVLKPVDDVADSGQASVEADAPRRGKQNATSSSEKENPLAKLGSHIASEWDKLGNNIGGEFDKVTSHIGGEFVKVTSHIASEWDKLGHNIGGEVDKIACGISKIFNHPHKKDCERKRSKETLETIQGTSSQGRPSLSGEMLENYIDKKMGMDARQHITTYLLVAQPLLADLAGLFAEMNMDDPTKV